LFPPF